MTRYRLFEGPNDAKRAKYDPFGRAVYPSAARPARLKSLDNRARRFGTPSVRRFRDLIDPCAALPLERRWIRGRDLVDPDQDGLFVSDHGDRGDLGKNRFRAISFRSCFLLGRRL